VVKQSIPHEYRCGINDLNRDFPDDAVNALAGRPT
jgi:hypothetical protein